MRLELDFASLIRSMCKELRHTGEALYAKGDQQEFVALLKNRYPELARPYGFGRGNLGGRMDAVFESTHNMWMYWDAIMDFLGLKNIKAVGCGILPTSCYTHVNSVPFVAAAYGVALVFELIDNPMRVLTDNTEAWLSGVGMEGFLDKIDMLGPKLEEDGLLMVRKILEAESGDDFVLLPGWKCMLQVWEWK